MGVAHHKDLVQHGAVVDEALEDAGRTDVTQPRGAEDQAHLQRAKRDTEVPRENGHSAGGVRQIEGVKEVR